MRPFLFWLVIAAIVGLTFYITTPPAHNFRVIDGDTIADGARHIRLWGIDAPELKQSCRAGDGGDYPCGIEARAMLQAIITLSGGEVACARDGVDQYGRDVSRCTAGGTDLAAAMVQEGFALDWPRYSGGAYATEQEQAKERHRGMWSGTFDLPWEWRWQNRNQ